MSPYRDLFDGCRAIPTDGGPDMMTAPAFAHAPESARRELTMAGLCGVTFMGGGVLSPLRAAWRECRRRGRARVVHVRPGTPLPFRSRGPKARFRRYVSPRLAWQGMPVGHTTPARLT